ncbi:permease-like cell division protein FtsX [Clostridium sp. LIBA-8841]|uniref:permease-like cell division protein FtsX n=1 Tax=Clostridium sp. LIBA-8841 TaxID=2987530 RepID=UPI002AC6200B|nr:permease-like cell division protein FtsX [Clostridium sp. LIBA-8841]MDZ5254609.1 permease-like cell division protein FtsX [Clostridium sp. LIBA-8841]
MKFSTIGYFISDAFKSLKRNRTISIASIATVLTTLFIFGAFLLTALNVKNGVTNVQDKVEINVFLKDDVTQDQKAAIEAKIKTVQGVKEVVFESKDQAFAKMEGSSDYNKEILAGYSKENNPLPASYIVRLENTDVASSVESAMKTNDKYMDGVEDVGNDEELIGTINSFVKVINTVGLVLGIVFVGVSLFLIVNTIKITVYSRRREVGIMKFVGATDWFIRWPFVIEGVIIGLVGGILSTLLLFAGYNLLYGKVVSASSLYMPQFVPPMYVLTTMSWQFILAGIVIGAVGSIIALRKFLDV